MSMIRKYNRYILICASKRENLSSGVCEKKGADQHAHTLIGNYHI